MTNQMLESFILTSKDNYAYSSQDLKQVTNTFDAKDYFENHADIFFFRIVDRVATYRLQTKSLFLDQEGRVSMWQTSGPLYPDSTNKDERFKSRDSFINQPEDQRNYAIYPMSKDAVSALESTQPNLTNHWFVPRGFEL